MTLAGHKNKGTHGLYNNVIVPEIFFKDYYCPEFDIYSKERFDFYKGDTKLKDR
jgi:hypothetical protein